MVPTPLGPLAVLAAAAAAAGLLAGCASVSDRTAATGSGASPAITANQSPAGSGLGSASAPASGAAAGCASAGLRVSVDTAQAGGAAGSTYYPVDFVNTSAAPCTLYGFPGVSFVTADRGSAGEIGPAAQRDPGQASTVVRLAAGGAAHAWLQLAQAGNYPPATCQPVTAHWLRVFPPGQTVPAYVSGSFAACGSAGAQLLTVLPVRAGKGVQGRTP